MSDNQDIIVIDNTGRPDISGAADSIRKLLDEGLSVQIIAARLGLDPDMILEVSDQSRAIQRQTADNGQRLSQYLEQLDEIIDLAYWQCKAEPHPNHVYAYTAALEEARGLMQDQDGRRDDQKLSVDLIKKVLEPMMSDTMISMTQTLAAFKQDLSSVLPAEQHASVTREVENMLRKLASVLEDQLTGAPASIARVLNDMQSDVQKHTSMTRRQKPKGR
jgi:hypothetical protein